MHDPSRITSPVSSSRHPGAREATARGRGGAGEGDGGGRGRGGGDAVATGNGSSKRANQKPNSVAAGGRGSAGGGDGSHKRANKKPNSVNGRGRGGGGGGGGEAEDASFEQGTDQNLHFVVLIKGKWLSSVHGAGEPHKVQESPHDQINGSRVQSEAEVPHRVRGLRPHRLGGVIFSCSNDTMKECIDKKLFGLPSIPHWTYVQHIRKGMPLFLFNSHEKKLYGVFEADCKGRMSIDPTAWTKGSGTTQYSAQVKVLEQRKCDPIPESDFKLAFPQLYFSSSRFMFELSQKEAGKLDSLFKSINPPPAGNFSRPNVAAASHAWRRACTDGAASSLKELNDSEGSIGGSQLGPHPGSFLAVNKAAIKEEKESQNSQDISEENSEKECQILQDKSEINSTEEKELVDTAETDSIGEKVSEILQDTAETNPADKKDSQMLQDTAETNPTEEKESNILQDTSETNSAEEIWGKLQQCLLCVYPSVSLPDRDHENIRLCITAILQMRQEILELKQDNLTLRRLLAEQHYTESAPIEHPEVSLTPKAVDQGSNEPIPPKKEEATTMHDPFGFLGSFWRK